MSLLLLFNGGRGNFTVVSTNTNTTLIRGIGSNYTVSNSGSVVIGKNITKPELVLSNSTLFLAKVVSLYRSTSNNSSVSLTRNISKTLNISSSSTTTVAKTTTRFFSTSNTSTTSVTPQRSEFKTVVSTGTATIKVSIRPTLTASNYSSTQCLILLNIFKPVPAATLDATNRRDRELLDYQPNLKRDKPPAIPVARATPVTKEVVPAGTESPAFKHLLESMALWNDVLAMEKWLSNAQIAYELALGDVTVPVESDALSDGLQDRVREFLGRDQVTFGDYKRALTSPHEIGASSYITKLWDRFHFGYDGRPDAQYYSDIVRINSFYFPVLKDSAQSLLLLTSSAILGSTDDSLTSLDVNVHLDKFVEKLSGVDIMADIPESKVQGFNHLRETLLAQVGEITYLVEGQVDFFQIQKNLPSTAEELIVELGNVITSGQGGLGGGIDGALRDLGVGTANHAIGLDQIIGLLGFLKMLFQLYNDGAWLDFSSLLNRLDQLVQELIYQLLGQAASVYAHIQSVVLHPLSKFIALIDTAFGGRQPAVVTEAATGLVVLLEGVVGKFQQHIVDFFRHHNIHTLFTLSKSDKIQSNNKLRNLVHILDVMIQVLQAVRDNGGLNWRSIGATVGQYESSRIDKYVHLDKIPQLAFLNPPPKATITEMTRPPTGSWGLQGNGSTADIARSLLVGIREKG